MFDFLFFLVIFCQFAAIMMWLEFYPIMFIGLIVTTVGELPFWISLNK